jgi:hypothetical protein
MIKSMSVLPLLSLLFTEGPVEDMLLLHSQHSDRQALAVIRHILTPYFRYNYSFCD